SLPVAIDRCYWLPGHSFAEFNGRAPAVLSPEASPESRKRDLCRAVDWANMRQRAVNLTFHGVGEIERRLDPGEELCWVTRDQFESTLDSIAGRSDVRITFDDGNQSDLEYALPALRKRGLNATFFVVAGRLDQPGFLDRAGVRELSAQGMAIGC